MHILCPHCWNPVEVARINSDEEIACPACGSTFRVADESTTGWDPMEQRKFGRFELIDTLGHGAFGTVYKARDPALDRLVAIKVPRSGNLAGPNELDRFLREARSAAQLRHPSIVSVHEVGPEDGLPYLVSDFIQGVTLADWLSARQLAPREAATLLAQVADALQYAHERGVVHRDVKPSNIMIGDGGEPHVMDFGLAKRDAGEVTMTIEGQVLRTPAYMSPEQARGEGHKVDGRSDVYSLGVVFYQLLTGELPFRGTQRMLLHQVMHDEPRRPRGLNDRLPKDLETICLKAMAKEPSRRYQSAREMADDLRRFLKEEPIHARPTGRLERAWRWARRRPTAAALVVVSAVAALASVAGLVGYLYATRLETAYRSEADARGIAENARKAEADERAHAEGALTLAEKARKAESEARGRERTVSEQNDRLRYLHTIALAYFQWREGNIERAKELLAQCPEHLRSWEWGYLQGLCYPEVFHVQGYDRITFLDDGRLLMWSSRPAFYFRAPATWAGSHHVRAWDPVTGDAHRLARDDFPPGIPFSPDGRLYAARGPDGILVKELATRLQVAALEAPRSAVAFSPDSRRLVVGSNNYQGRVWDLVDNKELFQFENRAVLKAPNGPLTSPDGTRMATQNHAGVKLWDTRTGKEFDSLPHVTDRNPIGLRSYSGGDDSYIAFSPDGSRLAATFLYQKPLTLIWDLAQQRRICTLSGSGGAVKNLVFSADGTHLGGVCPNGGVTVWDLSSNRELFTFQAHAASLRIAFSPDGQCLASSGRSRSLVPEVKVWNLGGTHQRWAAPLVSNLAFDRDSRQLRTSGLICQTWDPATGLPASSSEEPVAPHPRQKLPFVPYSISAGSTGKFNITWKKSANSKEIS